MKRKPKKSAKTAWLAPGWSILYLAFVPTKEAWDREMKALGLNETWDADKYAAATYSPRNTNKLDRHIALVQINMAMQKTLMDVMGSLAHEASHVVDYHFAAMGEDAPGGEVRAYALEAVFGQLMQAWWDTIGKDAKLKLGL